MLRERGTHVLSEDGEQWRGAPLKILSVTIAEREGRRGVGKAGERPCRALWAILRNLGIILRASKMHARLFSSGDYQLKRRTC